MHEALPHILVFDSGVGALSIISEIRQALPLARISYASDNDFFPYGTKSEAALVARVEQVLQALVAQCRPDMVVVACNTASTLALPHIRAHFNLPIVGVVPAIKPAALLSTTKVIGLLATPGTISRPYTHQLIKDFAADCEVIPLGSSRLVELAELKLRGKPIPREAVREALAPLMAAEHFGNMDTVVLACTHFPLIREELSAVLGKPLRWIDSGEAIARRVCSLLGEHKKDTAEAALEPRLHQSLFTRPGPEVEQLVPHLQRYLPGPVDFLALSEQQAMQVV